MLVHVAVQLTFAEPPPNITQPLRQSVWPMLEAHLLAPNLACRVSAFGLSNLWPLGLLLLGAFVPVAFAGRLFGSRLAFGGCALALAALGLASELWFGTPLRPAEQAGWLNYVRVMAKKETQCRAPWIPNEAAPARR